MAITSDTVIHFIEQIEIATGKILEASCTSTSAERWTENYGPSTNNWCVEVKNESDFMSDGSVLCRVTCLNR